MPEVASSLNRFPVRVSYTRPGFRRGFFCAGRCRPADAGRAMEDFSFGRGAVQPYLCTIYFFKPMPKDSSIRSVLIVGSGPIIIGQACEFDYSGSQAARSLREEGIKVILINSNPATIMTDPMMADKVYLLPLTVESIEQILEENEIDAVLPTMGGQTALNLAKEAEDLGIWEKYGVRLIGVDIKAIDKAEDREKFR